MPRGEIEEFLRGQRHDHEVERVLKTLLSAIRCAQGIVAGAMKTGVHVRAGLHTGDCESRGDDLAGIAVHIGARVAALARADEVLVTSTVRDLVAGSGIEFTDRGDHELKGVPGSWRLLAVRD